MSKQINGIQYEYVCLEDRFTTLQKCIGSKPSKGEAVPVSANNIHMDCEKYSLPTYLILEICDVYDAHRKCSRKETERQEDKHCCITSIHCI